MYTMVRKKIMDFLLIDNVQILPSTILGCLEAAPLSACLSDLTHGKAFLAQASLKMWRRALQIGSSLRRSKVSSDSSIALLACHRSSSLYNPILIDSSTPIENWFSVRSRLLFSSASSSRLLGFRQHYATAAEAIAVTSSEHDDEIRELVPEIKEHDTKKSSVLRPMADPSKQLVEGMSRRKYSILMKRQVKMETEANEYQELLTDMCQQKLAPNFPYMKTLFLGWFEPLRNAISAEQDSLKEGRSRIAYAPYWDLLPADMMVVITMHKMMALLMSGTGHGNCKVVQAACHIGEAIGHEIRIHRFFAKTKNKKKDTTTEDGSDSHDSAKEEERLRRKVNTLIKQHHVRKVSQIVKDDNVMNPWGQENQAKLLCDCFHKKLPLIYSLQLVK